MSNFSIQHYSELLSTARSRVQKLTRLGLILVFTVGAPHYTFISGKIVPLCQMNTETRPRIVGVILIDGDKALKAGITKGHITTPPVAGGQYFVNVEVFHQLHCLVCNTSLFSAWADSCSAVL